MTARASRTFSACSTRASASTYVSWTSHSVPSLLRNQSYASVPVSFSLVTRIISAACRLNPSSCPSRTLRWARASNLLMVVPPELEQPCRSWPEPLARLGTISWDLDLTDAGDGGALGHKERQQSERVLFAADLHRPPDRVPAGAARGQGRPVAQGAVVSFERGEHHTAFVRIVAVVQ